MTSLSTKDVPKVKMIYIREIYAQLASEFILSCLDQVADEKKERVIKHYDTLIEALISAANTFDLKPEHFQVRVEGGKRAVLYATKVEYRREVDG